MKRTNTPLSTQLKKRAKKKTKKKKTLYSGDATTMISTGSTLLDLAISGGRAKGGGIPLGIFVEIFGVPSSGKTVLACEIAGDVQRKGGELMFFDPEARLDRQFAQMFGMHVDEDNYIIPYYVPDIFKPIREWEPSPEDAPHIICADSLAALTTEMEMADKDEYGGRRAKEFSTELRKTNSILKKNNYLLVCTNQIRDNFGAGPFEPKHSTPGGKAIPHYASLRLHCRGAKKLKEKKRVLGKPQSRIVGVEVEVFVHKSSVWKPFRSAPVTIIFDYGIDDIRQNLQFVKTCLGETVYTAGKTKLNKSMEKSIAIVENEGLERKLRNQTIRLWEEIESEFSTNRKPKRRL